MIIIFHERTTPIMTSYLFIKWAQAVKIRGTKKINGQDSVTSGVWFIILEVGISWWDGCIGGLLWYLQCICMGKCTGDTIVYKPLSLGCLVMYVQILLQICDKNEA